MDLYYDRNMEDIIISSVLVAIEEYLSNDIENNIIREYGILDKTSDINIHFGVKSRFKKNTNFRELLMNNYKYNIIIEQGFLNRKKYQSIGINGFSGLSKIKPTNSPGDRFDKLNINVKDIVINNDGYILFCGQLPWDSQVQDINYNQYLNNIFNKLKKLTSRKIKFRFHPLYKDNHKSRKHKINIPEDIEIDQNINLIDSIKESFCVISYNSNSLVDSLLEGIPVITLSKVSIIYDITENDINNINNMYIPSKDIILQKLYDISYLQYTLDEFRDGTAIKYAQKLINDNYN
jgi:hypothetical protein